MSRTGRSIIPKPTMSKVGISESTSTFAPACGFHMPYMPSKLDLPDRALLFWACKVELSSVITSFKTVERPTVKMKEKKNKSQSQMKVSKGK